VNLKDTDHVLTEGAAWFTVGKASVRLRTDEAGNLRVVVFRLGEEDGEPVDGIYAAGVLFFPAHLIEGAA
jgi:hypothetical protein